MPSVGSWNRFCIYLKMSRQVEIHQFCTGLCCISCLSTIVRKSISVDGGLTLIPTSLQELSSSLLVTLFFFFLFTLLSSVGLDRLYCLSSL